MRTHWKVLIAVSVLFNAFSLVLASRVIADHFRLTYPAPEMEIAFIRNYTPKGVVASFQEPDSAPEREQLRAQEPVGAS